MLRLIILSNVAFAEPAFNQKVMEDHFLSNTITEIRIYVGIAIAIGFILTWILTRFYDRLMKKLDDLSTNESIISVKMSRIEENLNHIKDTKISKEEVYRLLSEIGKD